MKATKIREFGEKYREIIANGADMVEPIRVMELIDAIIEDLENENN